MAIGRENSDIKSVYQETIVNYIKSVGRYVAEPELYEKFKYHRSTLWKYGISITDINKSCGYVRRPAKVVRSCSKTKQEIQDLISKAILAEGKFTPRQTLKLKYKIHDVWISFHNIDILEENSKHGYIKKTAFQRDRFIGLVDKIKDYIRDSPKYVPHAELVDRFDVSIGWLTLNIDVPAENARYGRFGVVRYWTNHIASMFTGKIEVITEKTFPDLLSESGNRLRVDIFLPDYNVGIEFDGPQHVDKNHAFYSDKIVRNDEVKNQYFVNKGWRLIRIPWVVRMKPVDLRRQVLERLKSLLTTAEFERINVIVEEEVGLGNQQPSS